MNTSKPLSFIFDVFGYYAADTTGTRSILRAELLPMMSSYDVDATIIGSGYVNSAQSTVGNVTNATQPSNPSLNTPLVNNTYFPSTILATAGKGAFQPTGGVLTNAADLMIFPLNTTKVNKSTASPVAIPVVPAPSGVPVGITDCLTILNLDEGASNIIVGCYTTQATGATNTQNLFCVNYMNLNYPNQKWILFIDNPSSISQNNINLIKNLYNVEVTLPGISRIIGLTYSTSSIIVSKGIEVTAFQLPCSGVSSLVSSSPYYIPCLVQCQNITVATNRTPGFNSSNNYYTSNLI